MQVSFGRFAFAILILAPFGLWLRPSFAGAAWRTHMARSAFGWLGVTCLFAAAARMALADATAISFPNPLVTMALAVVMLGERVSRLQWFAAGVAVLGVVVLVRVSHPVPWTQVCLMRRA